MSDSPTNNSIDKADKNSDKSDKQQEKEKGAETKGWLFKWTNYIKGNLFYLTNNSFYRYMKHYRYMH